MAKVTIITDSSCCLPRQQIDQYGIVVVPLGFVLDGDTYEDGALSAREFYERLATAQRFPTTTAPAPGAFLEAFRLVGSQAGTALCITLAAKYSGTYNSAVAATELARDELKGFQVEVLDSQNLAMAHGFVVLAAARAAAVGAPLQECLAVSQEVASRAYLLGVLDTLRYLARSGRVPWIVHWATSILQIKPILAAAQAEVKAIERVRTRPRALDRLLEHTKARIEAGRPLHIAVMHADAVEEAGKLEARVRKELRPQELLITEFTSVMGIHSGPGFVGLAFYTEAGG